MAATHSCSLSLFLTAATGDPDNGFDIFADVPSDGDDVDIDHLFDDGITASIATYLLPAENTNRSLDSRLCVCECVCVCGSDKIFYE